jgi:hypothetical protein
MDAAAPTCVTQHSTHRHQQLVNNVAAPMHSLQLPPQSTMMLSVSKAAMQYIHPLNTTAAPTIMLLPASCLSVP